MSDAPDLAADDRDLAEDDGEVTHGSRVRCPYCGATHTPRPDGDGSPEPGENDAVCSGCGRRYTYEAEYLIVYTSRPRADGSGVPPVDVEGERRAAEAASRAEYERSSRLLAHLQQQQKERMDEYFRTGVLPPKRRDISPDDL